MMRPSAQGRRNIARGILLLARFDPAGFAEFGDRPSDFLNSLAPLLAFSLVALGLRAVAGYGLAALDDFLMTLVAVLTPAVLTYELARRWSRQSHWVRYATALTWSHWIILVVLMAALSLAVVLYGAGMSVDGASRGAMLAVIAYEIPFHWFLARRGLDLARWRAAVLVLLVEVGTYIATFAPLVLSDPAILTAIKSV